MWRLTSRLRWHVAGNVPPLLQDRLDEQYACIFGDIFLQALVQILENCICWSIILKLVILFYLHWNFKRDKLITFLAQSAFKTKIRRSSSTVWQETILYAVF